MSAIGGIWRFDGPVQPEDVVRVRGALHRFGRDAQSYWAEAGLALISCLFHSTPEDLFEQQPLIAADGSQVLVFAGRLDNRDELAQALRIPSLDLPALPDSSLLLQMYSRWGEATLHRLLGEFAFALWDRGAQRLLLARDPMGMRPLYWAHTARLFAFSSSPRALHELPELRRGIDEECVADFLAVLPSRAPRSLYAGIQCLMPGQAMVLEDGQRRLLNYYSVGLKPTLQWRRDEDYAEAFREHFDAAVRACLRSRGAVGSMLSSGFDSSTVSAAAASQLALDPARKLTCFTAVPTPGFAGPVPKGRHADESVLAASLLRRYANIEHVRVAPRPGLVPMLYRRAQNAGAPMFAPSNGWLEAIWSEAQDRGIRVLLTGALGNLTLSYDGHWLLSDLLSQGRWVYWASEARALYRRTRRLKPVVSRSLGALLPSTLYYALAGQLGQRHDYARHSAIHPDFVRSLKLEQRITEVGFRFLPRVRRHGRFWRLRVLFQQDRLADYQLDALASRVDLRDPTRNLRFAEFSLSVPEGQFMRLGVDRWLLRRAYGDLVPPELTSSPTKGLQSADWFETVAAERGEIYAELDRLDRSPLATRCLDLASMRRDLKAWPRDGWQTEATIMRYQYRLLRGLAVGVFLRAVEGDGA